MTRNHEPQAIGKLHDFKKELVKGGDFWFTTLQKISNPNMPYVFYIEGDGKAFIRKTKVSNNPTPHVPLVINLAAMDKRPNVVYIARPCQYTPMHLNPKCTDRGYWTNKRFSEEVVASMNEVIERINNDSKFSLIGFSGGGAIAVLIAARNNNVKDIITVAGNLDHHIVNQYNNVKVPLIGSLNAIDYVERIRTIPQLHLSGGKDKIIPILIADRFVKAANSTCVHQHVFSDNTHNKGWEPAWEFILEQIPLSCYR